MKTYVITGSTSGIGKALTEEFSKNNLVFAGYRNEKLKPEGKNIIPFYIDYTKSETIQAAIDEINSKTDKIYTVINAAGCVVAGMMENISMEDLRRQFDVNVFGGFEFSRGLNADKIINLSSLASFGIYPFIAPYCASKRAMDILFNLYQLETKCNVQVISLKLGVIATPIWTKSIEENDKNLKNITGYEKTAPLMIEKMKAKSQTGMPVEKLVRKIVKIENIKSPKPSYTIGLDAKIAEIISYLPQSLINFLIKISLKK